MRNGIKQVLRESRFNLSKLLQPISRLISGARSAWLNSGEHISADKPPQKTESYQPNNSNEVFSLLSDLRDTVSTVREWGGKSSYFRLGYKHWLLFQNSKTTFAIISLCYSLLVGGAVILAPQAILPVIVIFGILGGGSLGEAVFNLNLGATLRMELHNLNTKLDLMLGISSNVPLDANPKIVDDYLASLREALPDEYKVILS